jgi:hypothetical protein
MPNLIALGPHSRAHNGWDAIVEICYGVAEQSELHSRVGWCIGFQRVMNERVTVNVFLFRIPILEWMYGRGSKVNLHHTAKESSP